MAVVTSALSTPLEATAATPSAGNAPGVTSSSITVGTISTQTGTLAANSSSVIYGERAYFNYINAQGGVNGRKIDYKYALDDGGNPTTFNQLANTLINQDHVFAVTGVATIFFSPSLFVESGIPTYGYNVTDNWAGAPNLFAAGGSTQYYQAGAAEFAYVARHTQAKPSIALVAYGVAASSNACQATETALKAEGYDISYVDLKINYPGSTVATDVQRMKTAGSNFVLSCMDVQGNVTMARAIQQYGLKATQLWLNGNDVPTLQANKTLMQGVYFATYHVPFTAPTRLYPGLTLYLQQMRKYEPKYEYNELAIQGWESAALFVQGVKAAGSQPVLVQRRETDQQAHLLHSRRPDSAGELGGRRSQRSRPAVLRGLHRRERHAVRPGAQQGAERLQLLPLVQHEGKSGVPRPARHPGAALARTGGVASSHGQSDLFSDHIPRWIHRRRGGPF